MYRNCYVHVNLGNYKVTHRNADNHELINIIGKYKTLKKATKVAQDFAIFSHGCNYWVHFGKKRWRKEPENRTEFDCLD
ncbi:MAG: hypothetical protein ABFQ62_01560 [Patescibacteria group bacterium]